MKVIILHGWAYDTKKWQPFLDALKQHGIETTMLDIPVLTKKVETPWDIDDYMQWLDQQVGAGPVVLIGHSNGGRLGLNYATRFPSKVAKLILLDSAGIPRTELKSRIKRTVFKALAKAGKPLTKAPAARSLLYKVARARDYLEAEPVARATMINLLKSDYDLDLSQVTVPVYIVWGRNDPMTPLKDAYTMQKKLAQAHEPYVIDDARHGPQFSHAQQVADYVAKALS